MAFLKALLLLLIFFNHNEPFAMRKLKERYIKKFLLEKTDHPQNINSTLPLRKQLQLLPRLPASKHASFTTQDTESVTVKSAPINPSSPLGRPRHRRANLSEPSNHLQKHHSHHTKHHQPGLNHHHSNHSRTTHHHHRRFHMKTTKTHGSKKNGNKKHHKHDKNKHNKKNKTNNKNKIHKSRYNDKHQQKSPHLRHPTPNPAFLHLQILPDEIRNSTPSSPMPATFVRVGDFDGESRSDESGFKSEESGFKSESRFEDVESSDEMFRNEALKNEVQRDTEGEFEKDRPKVRFEGVREETRGTFSVLFCSLLFCSLLFCSVLFCSLLFCSVLFCSVRFCSVLFCFVLFCSVFCFVLFCSVLFCFSSVLFCFVLFCSVLFCSALFCSVLFCSVLFCSVLFCSVLFCCVLVNFNVFF